MAQNDAAFTGTLPRCGSTGVYGGGGRTRFAFAIASAYISGPITGVKVGSLLVNQVRTYISSAILRPCVHASAAGAAPQDLSARRHSRRRHLIQSRALAGRGGRETEIAPRPHRGTLDARRLDRRTPRPRNLCPATRGRAAACDARANHPHREALPPPGLRIRLSSTEASAACGKRRTRPLHRRPRVIPRSRAQDLPARPLHRECAGIADRRRFYPPLAPHCARQGELRHPHGSTHHSRRRQQLSAPRKTSALHARQRFRNRGGRGADLAHARRHHST